MTEFLLIANKIATDLKLETTTEEPIDAKNTAEWTAKDSEKETMTENAREPMIETEKVIA